VKTASTIAPAMQSFVIEGGRALGGTVRASGNKNAALPILAGCVLATDEVRLSNVPRIRDVETMVELLAEDVEWWITPTVGVFDHHMIGRAAVRTSMEYVFGEVYADHFFYRIARP